MGHGARQSRVVADGDAECRVARGHAHRSQPRQDPRRGAGDVRLCVLRRRWQNAVAARDIDDSRRGISQGGPRQGRHRQIPGRRSGRAEGRLRRHHHQRALHPAQDAAGDPHGVPRVLRPGARFDAGDRRDQEPRRCVAEARTRARDARRARASRRELRQGGRLRDQSEAPRPAEDDASRRHRRRRRERGGKGCERRDAHREPARRRGLRRGLGRGAQAFLARSCAHRRDRAAHQRLQDQRGRRHPIAAARRLHRRHRAHQHRALADEQDSPGGRARAVLRESAVRPRVAAGRRRAAGAGDRRGEGRRSARARRRRAREVAGFTRPHRRDVPCAAGPYGGRVVEERAQGAARARSFRDWALRP